MGVNFRAIAYCNWGKSLVLFGFLFLLFTNSGFAQEIPCLDARSERITFVKSTGKSASVECGNRRRQLNRQRQNGVEFVSVSGHVTHQNGVRMSGVTVTLEDFDMGTIRTVVTDETGTYFFGNVPFGSKVELMPSKPGYQFFPPSVTFGGISEDEVWNFIASGPPPNPPPPPANQPTLAWSSYFDHTPQLGDYNAMLGRDAAGNVYVGGTSLAADYDKTGNTDIVLFKTDANGNRVWSRSFNGAGDFKDGLRDLAVDSAGNVYLAGYSYSGEEGNGGVRSYNYATLKYDTNGNLLWTKYYAGNPGYDDSPNSLKIDSSGNVYVAGYSWGVGTFANYATVKYDANGNQMWAKRFAGGNGDMLNEVEVDSAGNVYVTGYSNHSAAGGSEDFVTIKYNAAGEQMWFNRYNSAIDDTDQAFELEIDSAGNVYVLGQSYDFKFWATIVHKINGASGATMWTEQVTATNGMTDEFPVTMKLDQSGNIFMTGMLSDIETYNIDSFVAKFDSNAMRQWVRIYDGPGDEDYDGDPKLVLDTAGNVFVGISSEGFANFDMQIIKYLPNGTIDWTYRFGNPYFGDDYFLDWDADVSQTTMLLDAQGNVYVAGQSHIPDQSTDLVVFKLEPQAQARAVPSDFDGDGKADVSVFRPETGQWYVLKSSDGNYTVTNWGLSGDKIVPADYDGDKKNDLAVYRDGAWYVLKSSDGNYSINQFGLAGDRPIPSDYDNDGKADLSVFRNGIWHSLASSNNAYKSQQFGIANDVPIPSDYDSNRRSDIAVFRSGAWYVQYEAGLPTNSLQFGIQTDKAVPADYDGDKKTDYAVFRNGVWYVWQSMTGSLRVFQWGSEGDVPVPADYDGDKKTDFAVYRQGVWYIMRSSDSSYTIVQFGLSTDIPVPSAYTR